MIVRVRGLGAMPEEEEDKREGGWEAAAIQAVITGLALLLARKGPKQAAVPATGAVGAVRALCPTITVEVLPSDFAGRYDSCRPLLEARPAFSLSFALWQTSRPVVPWHCPRQPCPSPAPR